MLDIRRELCFN